MVLLLFQRRLQVMTQQRKEARNSKCLIAIPQHLPVYRMFIEDVGHQGDDGVNGYHE